LFLRKLVRRFNIRKAQTIASHFKLLQRIATTQFFSYFLT